LVFVQLEVLTQFSAPFCRVWCLLRLATKHHEWRSAHWSQPPCLALAHASTRQLRRGSGGGRDRAAQPP